MSRYQILIADPLLDPELGMRFPPGVKLAGVQRPGPAGCHWHFLDDPDAPPDLEGRDVEIKVRRVDGQPVIAERRAIVTHLCPQDDSFGLGCCAADIRLLPHADRVTDDKEMVTCGGAP